MLHASLEICCCVYLVIIYIGSYIPFCSWVTLLLMKRHPHGLFLHNFLQTREQSSSRNVSYTLELLQTDSSWNGLPCWQVICTSGSCSQEHTRVRKWHLQGSYSVNEPFSQAVSWSVSWSNHFINQLISHSRNIRFRKWHLQGRYNWVITHSFNQSTNQSINQSINRSIDQSINQSINQPINQSTNQSINRSFNHSINQSINRSINWSINQLINQSINRSINHSINHPVINQSINWSVS